VNVAVSLSLRLDVQLSIVGSPYWMAPECIAGKKYNEKVGLLLLLILFLHYDVWNQRMRLSTVELVQTI